MSAAHDDPLAAGAAHFRHGFAFGRNWSYFLKHVNERTIQRAEESLRAALACQDLSGKTFLDLGCGSGLFSLAAWRLGARVQSLDIDDESVACACELKERFAAKDERWTIAHGSALDAGLSSRLGQFDVVYCWGVLHHTGNLWQALENTLSRVAPGGRLFVAIYNDQGVVSVRWRRMKRLYNRLPSWLRFVVWMPALARVWGPTTLRDLVRLRPFATWRNYGSERGMNAWRDFIDWVGGYPFEVAKPEEVFDFCHQRGLTLTYLKTCGGGLACNEFVFANPPACAQS